MLDGHLSTPETLNLLFGHLLYGLLVGAIALFAASVSESAATAAIVTLAFTIGSWVLDFTVAGHPGLLEWISPSVAHSVLRTFEQGLLSAGLVMGIGTLCAALRSGSRLDATGSSRPHQAVSLTRVRPCSGDHFRPGGADQILG